MEAAGRGGAFHGSASLPSFVLYLDFERCVRAQSERRGGGSPSLLSSAGEMALRIITGEEIELEILRKGEEQLLVLWVRG